MATTTLKVMTDGRVCVEVKNATGFGVKDGMLIINSEVEAQPLATFAPGCWAYVLTEGQP